MRSWHIKTGNCFSEPTTPEKDAAFITEYFFGFKVCTYKFSNRAQAEAWMAGRAWFMNPRYRLNNHHGCVWLIRRWHDVSYQDELKKE